MKFSLPLLRGTLLRRYQRFLADVELENGSAVTAHCPNPGRMTSCAEPGRPVLLSDHGPGTSRKLRYTWEAIRMGRTWVGVNTMNPNRVVHEALRQGTLPELSGYAVCRPEVVYGTGGRSRVDFFLSGHARLPDCYLEVKNTTLRVGAAGRFPDALTARGRKHLEDLAREARRGRRAVIFFFVGRADCRWFGPADAVDPEYGRMLRRVVTRAGVEALAYRARVSPQGIAITRRIEVRL